MSDASVVDVLPASQFALLSVIIPCYRCSLTISRAVASIAAQTIRPAEVILVDDKSGDGTVDKLLLLQSQYEKGWIKVIEMPVNGGPGTARNAGWAAASQEYIAFLDADDSWHQMKVEIQYGWMINNKDAVFTGHLCEVVNEVGFRRENNISKASVAPDKITKMQLLFSNKFMTPTVMLKRGVDFRMKAGKRYSEDYDLWLRMAFNDAGCYLFRVKLAYLYKAEFGVGGLSANLVAIELGEISNYFSLYKGDKINFIMFIVSSGYSLVKFFRRCVIVQLRKLFGKC